MSIKETQKDLIERKLIQEQLQKGEYPSASTIEKLVEERYVDRISGLPRFIYRAAEKGKSSNSVFYNAMLDEIKEDLTVGFEEIRKLNNRIMALANYYAANKVRIDKELNRIELHSKILATRSKSHINRDIVGDNLSDFTQIEMIGEPYRNIPKTNTFVDLRHSEASISKAKNSTVKHDLSNAKISFKSLTENTKTTHLSNFTNALIDTVHDSWRSVISSDKTDGVIGELTIELDEPIPVNHINIELQSGKATTITLMLSKDGDSYVEYESRKITTSYQWGFEQQMVRSIRFRMEKREEDYSSDVRYEYIFGAKLIEAKADRYDGLSYFVSLPFSIHNHDAIDYIHLNVDDYLPSGTNIRYYIGLDYEGEPIQWQEIQKHIPIPMKMAQEYKIEIDSYSNDYGDLMHTVFGHNYYRIIKLPHKPLDKSISMMIGRHMWLKETLPAPFTYEPATDDEGNEIYQPVYKTSLKDWIRSGTPKKEYMNIENYQDTLLKDTFQRYTTYIYMEESIRHEGTITISDDSSMAFYVNNNLIKAVGGSYQIQLKQGWNKLEILTYARALDQEILLGLYLREIAHNIYASRDTLQQVSLYDLLNNTSPRLHNRFAVDSDNNIIVNYNPKELDVEKHGVEYSLSYRFSTSSKDKHQIRFMAILSKEDPQSTVSPKMKEYQLIIE